MGRSMVAFFLADCLGVWPTKQDSHTSDLRFADVIVVLKITTASTCIRKKYNDYACSAMLRDRSETEAHSFIIDTTEVFCV